MKLLNIGFGRINVGKEQFQRILTDYERSKLRSLTDRKSTRLNSSHVRISYAVFCLKKILSALWSIWVVDLRGSYSYIGATFTVFALPQILLRAILCRPTVR